MMDVIYLFHAFYNFRKERKEVDVYVLKYTLIYQLHIYFDYVVYYNFNNKCVQMIEIYKYELI